MDFSMRNLHDRILRYEGTAPFTEVLKPWVDAHDYKGFVSSLNDGWNLSHEENWELYALSRVLDLLMLGMQPDKGADGSGWPGPKISIEEYVAFNNSIGLETQVPVHYDPFNCEIVEARAGNESFQIAELLFPVVKLKNLLVKRGGVVLGLDPGHHQVSLINNATLYWAYRRKNRRHRDLSQGWGSNSTLDHNSFSYHETWLIFLNANAGAIREIA